MYSILFLTATSFICCLILTPLVRIWSAKHGVVDRPNSRRKLHSRPVPHTGGVAIVGAYLAALGLLLLSPLKGAATVNLPQVATLLPAVTIIFVTGLVDDLVGLSPWEKLLGQVGAACLAYLGGLEVTGVAGHAAHGWWTLPITVLWLVGCTNAFNLIDGVDGLATGVGLFAAFTALTAGLLHNNAALALATAPLVGALLAFLRYNFNPASIFLGDSGSLTIGFMLGCFGAIWSHKSTTLLGMTAPLMALAVPLLDTTLSVVRRFLRHQPIFASDRNHIHHRLLDRGFTPRQVVLALYGVCGVAACFSIIQTTPNNRFDGLLLVVFCLVVWVAVQFLGYGEFDAARQLMVSGTFRHILNARVFVRTFEQTLAVAATPEDYWKVVRSVSREFGFAEVRMSLAGMVFEDRGAGSDLNGCCSIRIPLSHDGYVNFRYPDSASVRHAVAISSIVEILQHSISSRIWQPQPQADERPASSVRTTRSLETAR